MNPSISSASLKKIHLFLRSLVKGHFYFVYFLLKVSLSRFILFK